MECRQYHWYEVAAVGLEGVAVTQRSLEFPQILLEGHQEGLPVPLVAVLQPAAPSFTRISNVTTITPLGYRIHIYAIEWITCYSTSMSKQQLCKTLKDTSVAGYQAVHSRNVALSEEQARDCHTWRRPQLSGIICWSGEIGATAATNITPFKLVGHL